MLHALLKSAHLIAVVVWIGGMFFAHFCLRPAAQRLEPPVRLALMADALRRFLTIVAWAAGIAVLTGGLMLGGSPWPRSIALDTLVMALLGLVMAAIYLVIRLVLFRRFERALALPDLPAAAAALAIVRRWVLVNLVIGVLILVVTQVGSAA
jgi:uncharacterized membrane protein